MTNLEVYAKDPRTHTLLNQGVAKVTGGQSADELKTLAYELRNFVCDGQYAEGLVRILSSYLGHLNKPEQPGVWVSGFYGSGKSHLVKMLQHLWTDFEFPDQARARGLAKLPDKVSELLTELSTAAKRAGGLHAAAGTLGAGAGESVRLELLGLVFRSVGLPEQYSRANFVLWLRDEKLEDGVQAFVKTAGGDFDKELANLYVSDLMAKAILDARPEFAAKPADVRLLLQKQFPKVADVSIEEMIEGIRRAVGRKGKLPCVLIVLDEVQQYIGDDVSRSKAVQDLVEQCCSRLGATVLIVATGQNALSGTPQLQRLQGRFPVTIELQDTDVEQVTREVVLKKKPTAEPAIKALLDGQSGEIARQLKNTKIEATTKDRALMVSDYPILPVRRRFWERVLRAVDKAGTGAQLRTQLWIVHDAALRTAELPLGHVVGGAFLYEHIKTRVLQSGVLLQEISETIARQAKEDDGDLRYQLCALIFLIGQLPHNNEPSDAGIRATADTLADLLVTDLTASSATLRKRVPGLLEKLVAAGAVMKVDDEYRMQTREGNEWNQTFLAERSKLLNDLPKLAGERSQLLKSQCGDIFKRVKVLHGVSKEVRKLELHFGDNPPQPAAGVIPVWVRDGWEVEEKTVLADVRQAGDQSGVVYVYIPKTQPEELKQAIASHYAASTALQAKGTPPSSEGMEARRAMETRQAQALRARETLIIDILNSAAVYLAGGDQMGGALLDQKVTDAGLKCSDRLFPLFVQADAPAADWEKVYMRAKNGAADALAAVSHKGGPEDHPVCKAVLDFTGGGRKGGDILKHFDAPKYGWPKDAVNAALAVLVHAGSLRAVTASKEILPVAKLDQKTITAVEFRCETIPPLTTPQLVAVRGLLQKVGLKTVSGQESANALEFVARLFKLAEAAGGDAPLPVLPDTTAIKDIANRVGNDQLKAIHDAKDALAQQIADWDVRKALITQRQPRWTQLTALLNFAGDLPEAAEVRPEAKAIETQRRLLDNPDAVPGLADKLTGALRQALKAVEGACVTEHASRLEALEATPAWKQLAPEQRHDLLGKHGIRQTPTVAVGTTDEILTTLRDVKLSELRAVCDALPTRFANAHEAAAKLLEPKAQMVTLPGGTIKTEADLQEWLEQSAQIVRAKLKEGPVIL